MARKQILTHKYADLYFDDATLLIEELWKSSTENMTDEEYKSFQYEKLEATRKVNPKLFLCDTEKFLYSMTPEMQEWTDEKLNKFWEEIGLVKFAFVMSKGFIEQIALELAMTERDILAYPVEYFDNQEKAKNWLLS